MIKNISIAVILLFTCLVSVAQATAINSSRSNIKHGVVATYSNTGGLELTFDTAKMSAADKAAFETGHFIPEVDITLTAAECKAIGVPPNKVLIIKKGRWEISKVQDKDTCKPGFAIKENGVK